MTAYRLFDTRRDQLSPMTQNSPKPMPLTVQQHNLCYDITDIYYSNNVYQTSLLLVRENEYQVVNRRCVSGISPLPNKASWKEGQKYSTQAPWADMPC